MDLLNKVERSILSKINKVATSICQILMDLLNKEETSILSKINGFVK